MLVAGYAPLLLPHFDETYSSPPPSCSAEACLFPAAKDGVPDAGSAPACDLDPLARSCCVEEGVFDAVDVEEERKGAKEVTFAAHLIRMAVKKIHDNMVRLCALLASFRSIFFSFIIVIMIVHSSA
jgi:hypothetical protein